MKLAKAIVKYRIPILILAIVLLIPATIGYLNTRVNYDISDEMDGRVKFIYRTEEIGE